MPEQNPDPNFTTPTTHQLLDSLTSHISFYSSNPNPNCNSNNTPRSSILKWFSSLTPHQRQSHLTFIQPNFVRILLQMLSIIRTRGTCSFLLLPDLPSSGDLPSLCHRTSRGLLKRAFESNPSYRRILESTLLFNSKEGEGMRECGVGLGCLDAVSVREGLVGVVEEFARVMDEVSGGDFLRGGEMEELGSNEWVELGWLKRKGYYGVEEFVANRLEVALRLAWLSSNGSGGGGGGGGRKRGLKLKEKIVAGLGANMFWRRKGCGDWWWGLDDEVRRKVVRVAVGKSAKNLVFFWVILLVGFVCVDLFVECMDVVENLA